MPEFEQYLVIYHFSFPIVIQILKELSSGINSSAVGISIY